MDDFLEEISTEIDFILKRHSSNLSRFKALFGVKVDAKKYTEIFEETLLSAKLEIDEVVAIAVARHSTNEMRECSEALQLVIAKSLRRFVLVNQNRV